MIDTIFTYFAIIYGACALAFFIYAIVLACKGYLIGGRGIPEAPPKWRPDKDDTNQNPD